MEKDIVRVLHRILDDYGLSQEQLAIIMGYSRGHLNSILTGKIEAKFKRVALLSLADKLGIDVDELLAGDIPASPPSSIYLAGHGSSVNQSKGTTITTNVGQEESTLNYKEKYYEQLGITRYLEERVKKLEEKIKQLGG